MIHFNTIFFKCRYFLNRHMIQLKIELVMYHSNLEWKACNTIRVFFYQSRVFNPLLILFTNTYSFYLINLQRWGFSGVSVNYPTFLVMTRWNLSFATLKTYFESSSNLKSQNRHVICESTSIHLKPPTLACFLWMPLVCTIMYLQTICKHCFCCCCSPLLMSY